MEANISMGTYCPKCNITFGTHVVMGGSTNCPNCNREMIAAPENKKTRTIANFNCKCGVQIGMMTVIGDDAKCPGCGKKI